MKNCNKLIVQIKSFFLFVIFVGGLVPACGPTSTLMHEQDEALLLSIAAHTRLSGDDGLDSYSVLSPLGVKLSAPQRAAAPGTNTELDILVNLYSDYLNTMRQQDNLNDRNVDRLVDQLQGKISALQKRSAKLQQRRRRRGRGLARFFRRVGRGIGRFIRRVGRAVGWAAEYLVEEVAPQVIKEMVLTGQPLTARVFWSGVRKLVRKRLKGALGSQLARRGVPVVLLERAGLSPEDKGEDQRTTDNQAEEEPDQGVTTEIGYGNWDLELVTNGDDCTANFEWRDFWDELPKNDIRDCRPALDSTFHIDIYLDEDASIPLTFLLDSGELTGGMIGSGESDLAYERVSGSVTAEIEDGWVSPRPDTLGWDFGGNLAVEAQAYVELRCWYNPPDPLEPGYFYWIDQEKSIQVITPFEGSTDQFVPGTEEQPGRVLPGGLLEMYAGAQILEGTEPQTEILLLCEGQNLPAEFPPPYVTEP
ncbi:MAG: hypothetical protein PVI04_10795 [Anaerolineales bacterium]|jgi:hypothetical protein